MCASGEVSGGVMGATLDGAELPLPLDAAKESGGERELLEGDGERDGGRGTWVGCIGSIGVEGVRTMEVFALTRDLVPLPLPLASGEGGSSCIRPEHSGRSTTVGGPVWGPARFRTEEKCSQS